MSDPAVSAAERTYASGRVPPFPDRKRVAAAREALAPIRAQIEDMREDDFDPECPTDFSVGLRYALNRIAKHAYPSEEL